MPLGYISFATIQFENDIQHNNTQYSYIKMLHTDRVKTEN